MIAFVEKLRNRKKTNQSLIDEIAIVLQINYDAAYRIVTGRSKLKLADALVLAKHFQVSLDSLVNDQANELIFIHRLKPIHNYDTIVDYLEESYQRLKALSSLEQSSIIYSSKDIPLFYTLSDNYLSRLKVYSWLWMMDKDFAKKKIRFEDFQLSQRFLSVAKELVSIYNDLNVTEFWNETTIQSSVLQLQYFSAMNLLNNYDYDKIKNDLNQLLIRLEEKSAQAINYQLYWNEMLLMNNSILVESNKGKSLFVPYNILGYFQTFDEDVIEEQSNFFELQKQNSVLVSGNNFKIRNLFFQQLQQQLE